MNICGRGYNNAGWISAKVDKGKDKVDQADKTDSDSYEDLDECDIVDDEGGLNFEEELLNIFQTRQAKIHCGKREIEKKDTALSRYSDGKKRCVAGGQSLLKGKKYSLIPPAAVLYGGIGLTEKNSGEKQMTSAAKVLAKAHLKDMDVKHKATCNNFSKHIEAFKIRIFKDGRLSNTAAQKLDDKANELTQKQDKLKLKAKEKKLKNLRRAYRDVLISPFRQELDGEYSKLKKEQKV